MSLGRLVTMLLASLLIVACTADDRDRIHLSEPTGRMPAAVDLVPVKLDDHEAFDRLDAWLALTGDVEDVVRVYNDLARLAPDTPLVLVRGALAVMTLDPQRGRSIAKGVLDRFKDRIPDDPDLRKLAVKVGVPGEAPAGDEAQPK